MSMIDQKKRSRTTGALNNLTVTTEGELDQKGTLGQGKKKEKKGLDET